MVSYGPYGSISIHMLPLELMSAPQVAEHVAQKVRRSRLRRAWTQEELAERSGMSVSSLRRFERTGQISFLSLVRIAVALEAVDGIHGLFPDDPASLDEILDAPRQRGRRS